MKSARIALAAVALAALAGCSATNPIQTQVVYAASDGARIQLGETIEAHNVLVLTSGKGQPGALIGSVTNRGEQDVVVNIYVTGAGTTDVELSAGESHQFAGEDVVRFDAVDAAPGENIAVTVSAGTEGSVDVKVPVLDGRLPEYAEVIDSL